MPLQCLLHKPYTRRPTQILHKPSANRKQILQNHPQTTHKPSNYTNTHTRTSPPSPGHDLDADLPPHEYLHYYSPDFRLHVPPHEDQKNENEPEALQKLLQTLLEHVSNIEPVAPAGGFGERPPDAPTPKRVKKETSENRGDDAGGDGGNKAEGGDD